MTGKRLSKSIKKYIRREKGRIRRQIFDLKEQEKQIQELYKKIFEKFKIKKTKEKTINQVVSQNLLTKEKNRI